MVRVTPALVVWILLLIFIVVAPLIGGIVNLGHGRGFWLNFSIALGFVSLSIFGVQFITTLRVRFVNAPLGMLGAFIMHRWFACAGAAFAIVHVIILMALDRKYWALLDVTSSPLRAKFAVASTLALIVLMVTSIWRKKLGISYRNWHVLHWVCALIVIGAALVHAVLVNNYMQDKVEQGIWSSLGLLFVLAAIWMRFVNPLLRWRRCWSVASISTPNESVTELELTPAAKAGENGHSGFSFKPGQFVWLVVGRSPFAICTNPFTIASSAVNTDRLRFLVQANSGYTAALQELSEGTQVYLDGPYGDFTPDPAIEGPLIMVAAGVGITPFIAMLETLADQGSKRTCILLVSNRTRADLIGEEHIEALSKQLDLTVHHVFSQEDEKRMDAEFIHGILPPNAVNGECFICGGSSFMTMAEKAFASAGISRERIRAERFSMA